MYPRMDISPSIGYLTEWTYGLLNFVCYFGFKKITMKFNVFIYLKIVGNCSQGIHSRILLIFLNDRLGLVKLG